MSAADVDDALAGLRSTLAHARNADWRADRRNYLAAAVGVAVELESQGVPGATDLRQCIGAAAVAREDEAPDAIADCLALVDDVGATH